MGRSFHGYTYSVLHNVFLAFIEAVSTKLVSGKRWKGIRDNGAKFEKTTELWNITASMWKDRNLMRR